MNKPFRYWHNKENCKAVASLCKSKSEFHTRYRAAYRASKQEGWFDELCKLYWNFSDWTIEQCKEEASKYTDRSEFYTHSRLAYKAAEANGWLEGICNHMMDSECYWTYELCAEEALKYSSKIEFAHNNEGLRTVLLYIMVGLMIFVAEWRLKEGNLSQKRLFGCCKII